MSWKITPKDMSYYILEHRLGEWYHDDVIKWKHFPRNWPFVRRIHRSRWIPHTKASDAELWCFLLSAPDWRLSKQPWGWWFQTPSWSLWRQSNVLLKLCLNLDQFAWHHRSSLAHTVITITAMFLSIICHYQANNNYDDMAVVRHVFVRYG